MSTSDLISPPAPAEAVDTEREPTMLPLLVVLIGTFMTFLDFFIVNVALPSMTTDLAAGPDALSLVVAGYGVTFATGMITGGRLGDIYGRCRLFTLGLVLFTLTSAACGLAPNIEALIVARVLQGAAGALLTPQVLAILRTVYRGERQAKAFAAYGVAMGVAGVLGQLLGGALIQADLAGSGWRAIFLINVPVGLVAMVLAPRVIPESHGQRTRLDVVGVVLATLTITAVVLPLVEGRQHGWPLWTWVSLAVAPVLAAEFAWWQRRRADSGAAPLVDLALFRARAFSAGSLVALTFALVPPAFFFVLAIYLQDGRGFSALFSGVVFAGVGGGYFAAMLVAGRAQAQLGRQVLALGAMVTAIGCLAVAAADGASSSLELLPGLALAGFGIGLVLVPLATTVLADVDAAQAGSASGVLSTAQQVGGALGVAVVSVIFFNEADAGTIRSAFTVSLLVLAGLTVISAILVQLLPRTANRSR